MLPSMVFRPNTQDAHTITEIADYESLTITATDVVLDLGANVGAFTRRALEAGARVISVEPEPSNFIQLLGNAPGAICMNAAVAKSAGQRYLRLGLTTTHGFTRNPWQLSDATEITVSCVTLPELVRAFAPTVIKCDIEGAEIELDWDCLGGVREVACELHQWVDQEWWKQAFADWECVKEPNPGQNTVGVWK